jgi:hypothetical protein
MDGSECGWGSESNIVILCFIHVRPFTHKRLYCFVEVNDARLRLNKTNCDVVTLISGVIPILLRVSELSNIVTIFSFGIFLFFLFCGMFQPRRIYINRSFDRVHLVLSCPSFLSLLCSL